MIKIDLIDNGINQRKKYGANSRIFITTAHKRTLNFSLTNSRFSQDISFLSNISSTSIHLPQYSFNQKKHNLL